MDQEISIEKIIDSVVREVIQALQKEGVNVVLSQRDSKGSDLAGKNQNSSFRNKRKTLI